MMKWGESIIWGEIESSLGEFLLWFLWMGNQTKILVIHIYDILSSYIFTNYNITTPSICMFLLLWVEEYLKEVERYRVSFVCIFLFFYSWDNNNFKNELILTLFRGNIFLPNNLIQKRILWNKSSWTIHN